MVLPFIENLRGIAILLVLVTHSVDLVGLHNNPPVREIYKYFITSGTYLFVLVAGYMFQYLLHKYAFFNYMKRRAKNVLLPYFLISIPIVIAFAYFLHRSNISPEFYDQGILYRIVVFYLTGSHCQAFWFIPMMTLYYLSSPLLAKLEKTRFIYYALLPGLVLLMVSVPKGWGPFQNFAHYLPVYLLGMFLSRYRESIFNTTDKHVELVTLAYLILISFAILVGNQKIEMPFIKLINALLLFFLFHRYESFLSLTRIGDVGLLSYGIYLIHPYVFACIRLLTGTGFGEPLAMNGKLPWELGAMLVAIILSILATFVSAKVLGKHSRLLIGCQQAKMQRVLATNHSPAKLPVMSRPVP